MVLLLILVVVFQKEFGKEIKQKVLANFINLMAVGIKVIIQMEREKVMALIVGVMEKNMQDNGKKDFSMERVMLSLNKEYQCKEYGIKAKRLFQIKLSFQNQLYDNIKNRYLIYLCASSNLYHFKIAFILRFRGLEGKYYDSILKKIFKKKSEEIIKFL